MKVFFYPHARLRDRQLDTIRRWPRHEVCNPELLERRAGVQVAASNAHKEGAKVGLAQRLPLLNVKRRPREAPAGAVVYVWGGVVLTGPFIVDLDNPWAFVGYNVAALPLYRAVLRHILLSRRCVEIRCLSEACRQSLAQALGADVAAKAAVRYPALPAREVVLPQRLDRPCRFLFVGTQFELKGGHSLLAAFERARAACPGITLAMITHVPPGLGTAPEGVRFVPANLSRDQVSAQFMKESDVLVHPSFMESFGMVLLEALSHGLALVTTRMYASTELVHDGDNGVVLEPPISAWRDFTPSDSFLVPQLYRNMRNVDFSAFVGALAAAMVRVASDQAELLRMRRASLQRWSDSFASNAA